MPRNSKEGPREGTIDMLSARSSAVRKRLGNLEKVTIEYIEACGDCFYLAMEAALSQEEGWSPYFTVATMREVVASSLTEEIFQLYTLLHQQQTEGAPRQQLSASRTPSMSRPGLTSLAAARRFQVHGRRRFARDSSQPRSHTRPEGGRYKVRVGGWLRDGNHSQPLPAAAARRGRALVAEVYAHRAAMSIGCCHIQ